MFLFLVFTIVLPCFGMPIEEAGFYPDGLEEDYFPLHIVEDQELESVNLGPGEAGEYEPLTDEYEGFGANLDEDYFFHQGFERQAIPSDQKIWSDWEKWTPCTRPCDTGKSLSWRHCIGGCCEHGEKEVRIKPCNTQPCKGGEASKQKERNGNVRG